MSSYNKDLIFHFGAPPTNEQKASEAIVEQGLNLIRLSPSGVNWSGSPTTIQPNFAIYRSALPAFIKAAATRTKVTSSTSPFGATPYSGGLLPFKTPSLVVNFRSEISEAQYDCLRNQWKGQDSVIRGKSVLVFKNPQLSLIKELLDGDKGYNVSEITPTVENTANIDSFRQLRTIIKMFTLFLKLHQYPAFHDAEHEDTFRKLQFGMGVTIKKMTTYRGDEMDTGDNATVTTKDSGWRVCTNDHMRFTINLPVPFDDAPAFDDGNHLPNMSGVFFAFNPLLAKFDAHTVPDVIRRYFFCGLGETEEECQNAYDNIKRAWGVLFNSEIADELSHIAKVIDIALNVQARVIPIFPKEGHYVGCVMQGAGYTLRVLRENVIPGDIADLRQCVQKSDPHVNAVIEIFKRLDFANEVDRQAARDACSRMWDLRKLIEALPSGNLLQQEVIKRHAAKLSFPEDRELVINAHNIELVIEYMIDPTKNLGDLPFLHHSMLFDSSRRNIALSAFGATAPSFRPISGKGFYLNQNMIINVKGPGGQFVDREITKMAVSVVPLSVAIQKLDEVIKMKQILNPYGNAQPKVSDNSSSKTFKDESFHKIIGALRKLTGSSIMGEVRGKKRQLESGGGSVKRSKLEDF